MTPLTIALVAAALLAGIPLGMAIAYFLCLRRACRIIDAEYDRL